MALFGSYMLELDEDSIPGRPVWKETDKMPADVNGFYLSTPAENNLPSNCGMDKEPVLNLNARPPVQCFIPPSPNDTPQSLFGIAQPPRHWAPRFIRLTNPRQMLIYTDGSCLGNASGPDSTAGCSFIFRPAKEQQLSHLKFRLELEGPDKVLHEQTSNRAELRAVIAALQFRVWWGEGFTSVVIATDSEYIVKGCTEWVRGWVQKGWRTSKKVAVKNRDLWELLLDEVERYREMGCRILFWRIPRELNVHADRLAKEAAAEINVKTKFCKMEGTMM
ncbi:MAG: hypothetical protein MMC33_010060 [Icmadophila ericetorum]|nr:hypothetical protein [Icmadophila ericetorum]